MERVLGFCPDAGYISTFSSCWSPVMLSHPSRPTVRAQLSDRQSTDGTRVNRILSVVQLPQLGANCHQHHVTRVHVDIIASDNNYCIRTQPRPRPYRNKNSLAHYHFTICSCLKTTSRSMYRRGSWRYARFDQLVVYKREHGTRQLTTGNFIETITK